MAGIRYDPETDYIQVCVDGDWKNWKLAQVKSVVLFDGQSGLGQVNTNISGGLSNFSTGYGTSITYSNTSICIKAVGQYTSGTYHPGGGSISQIDLTHYSKLRVYISSLTITAGYVGFVVSKERSLYSPPKREVVSATGWHELDISDLSGNYYVNFGGTGPDGNFTCYIDCIMLI